MSDPVDQIGPIGSGADSGKSYMGGYRAERNALLKFIADHHITNVVFLATDDHQNRINEVTYSPTGQTGLQSTYVKVPFCFSIVAGPLGATGPDAITDHSFATSRRSPTRLPPRRLAPGSSRSVSKAIPVCTISSARATRRPIPTRRPSISTARTRSTSRCST